MQLLPREEYLMGVIEIEIVEQMKSLLQRCQGRDRADGGKEAASVGQ
jgi:hypothetical protein